MEDMRYDRKTEEINRKVYLLSDQVHIYNKHTQKALRLLKLASMPDASIIG